jgi:hypothetical protein
LVLKNWVFCGTSAGLITSPDGEIKVSSRAR